MNDKNEEATGGGLSGQLELFGYADDAQLDLLDLLDAAAEC